MENFTISRQTETFLPKLCYSFKSRVNLYVYIISIGDCLRYRNISYYPFEDLKLNFILSLVTERWGSQGTSQPICQLTRDQVGWQKNRQRGWFLSFFLSGWKPNIPTE